MIYIKPDDRITKQILHYGKEILLSQNMQMERNFRQHDTTDCYEHSICVAYICLKLAKAFHWHIDTKSMVRGALLHDYFLYDWHDGNKYQKTFHTYVHPLYSLRNAKREYDLNAIEKDVILKHMFPLTPMLPRYKETILITIADKCCAAGEIWHFYSMKKLIAAVDTPIVRLLQRRNLLEVA